VAVAGPIAWLLASRPSAQRDWAIDHAVTSASSIEGYLLTVRNVRDFRYAPDGTPEPHWYDATYHLDSLDSAWFVLTVFSRTSRIPAHTFVSFGFSDGRFLSVSVEARRERDESYGVLAGAFRRFELIYVIGDERDLIGRRAAIEGDDTYLYPVRGSREAMRATLVAMLERANQLQQRPEFYNSIWNNCTSNLVRHVNQVAPGRIPAGWMVMVPGYADEVALGLGLIDAEGDVYAARGRYRINERARAALANDSFSVLIRR
jgi:hypothetical protein